MLGAAITLPMILVSGPIAGFILGRFLFVNRLNAPEWTIVVFVFFGFVGSGVQSYKLIKQINQADSKKNPDSKKTN